MKYLIFILILCSCSVGTELENASDFKGHWRFCHQEYGYSELLISDSLIHLMNEENFAWMPKPYTISNNQIVEGLNGDTLNKPIVKGNQMIIDWFGGSDTLVRMTDSLLTFYDFDCSRQMNMRQFNDFLFHAFMSRKLRYSNFCSSLSLQALETPDATLADIDVSDVLPKPNGNKVSLVGFDYKIIADNFDQDLSPKLIDLVYLNDSTEVFLTVQESRFCYVVFSEHLRAEENGTLQISMRNLETPCEEKCLIHFYLHIQGKKLVIEGIEWNGERLKLNHGASEI